MEGKKGPKPSPQPVPLKSPSLLFPMPRDSVQGAGCRPSCSGHRLALTGGLCAQPQCSSVFWALPGSGEARLPHRGGENTLSLGDTLALKSGEKCSSFQLGLLTPAQTHPRGFPQREASSLVSSGRMNTLAHTRLMFPSQSSWQNFPHRNC